MYLEVSSSLCNLIRMYSIIQPGPVAKKSVDLKTSENCNIYN